MDVVVDTSVLLDMQSGLLWEPVSGLGLRWFTTDLIASEVRSFRLEQACRKSGLIVAELESSLMPSLVRLIKVHRHPTYADLSALCLASHLGAGLLTNDRALREAARAEGVGCHGTLWLLDQLVLTGAIDGAQACAALSCIRTAGSWLPDSECLTRVRNWTTSQE